MKREMVRWTGYRSPLGAHIEAYLIAKRALGMRSPTKSGRFDCLTDSSPRSA